MLGIQQMSRSFSTTKQSQQQRLDQLLQKQFGQESLNPLIFRTTVLYTCLDGRKIYKTASELHNEYVQSNHEPYLVAFRSEFHSRKSFLQTFWESKEFQDFVYKFECDRPKREKADRQTVQKLRALTLSSTLPTVKSVSILRPEDVSLAMLKTCNRKIFVQLYKQIEDKTTFSDFKIFLIILMYLYRFGKRTKLTGLQIPHELQQAIERNQDRKLKEYYTTNIQGTQWIQVFLETFNISSTNLQQDLKQ